MPTPTYTPLANVTVAVAAASITFSSIPATYRDLVLVVESGSTIAGNDRNIRFNSDSGGNYFVVEMNGSGIAPASSATSSRTSGYIGYNNSTARTTSITQLLDYSATDKHKTSLSRFTDGSSFTGAMCNRWANTAAITSVTVFPSSSTFAAGSTFALYGIAS
jgi:hypothetical protein